MQKGRKYDLLVKVGLARFSACACEAGYLAEMAANAAIKAAVNSQFHAFTPTEEQRALLLIAGYLTTAEGLREAAERLEKTADLLNTVVGHPFPEGTGPEALKSGAIKRLGEEVSMAALDDIVKAREGISAAITAASSWQNDAINAKWDALEADQATDQEPEDTDEDFGSCQCSACQAEAQNEQPDPAA